MTGGNARRAWHDDFAPGDLDHLRLAIPDAVEDGQRRSGAAHVAYADADGDQFVYGAGMSRAVYKRLGVNLASLDSFHTETVDGTRRQLMFVGRFLIFPIRVGKRMPKNINHVRISYLPDDRRDMFAAASVHKFDPPSLFTVENTEETEAATLDDARARLRVIGAESLIVPFYSSGPDGVGSIYWAPAKTSEGKYLDFIDPERLTYSRSPVVLESQKPAHHKAAAFADGARPRTPAKLRPRPKQPDGA